MYWSFTISDPKSDTEPKKTQVWDSGNGDTITQSLNLGIQSFSFGWHPREHLESLVDPVLELL